jgi:hypothetical protein
MAIPIRLSLVAAATLTTVLGAQLPGPPTIMRGTAPNGDVRSMSNNQNSLASLADGSLAAVIYKQSTATTGGHLTLGISTDFIKWTFYSLPHNTGHRVHEWESGVLCAGHKCDVLHVGWSDRSVGGVYHSAWYQTFSTSTRKWIGAPVRIAAANASLKQSVQVRDITVTPLDTVAIAYGIGATGGLGMGAYECAIRVRKKGQSSFSAQYAMRSGGLSWSREASIVASGEVIHCAFKNQKGDGGIAYRSFDTTTLKWQQASQVMVGPNNNGTRGIDGINAGNKALISKDTRGGLYIMYVTGSTGGLKSNNKMRMAYAKPGTGSNNADWKDLEVMPHTTTLGKNPRGVGKTDPSYPMMQGGDTSCTYYTLAPGFQGSMIIVYSKPWEDFQNMYLQIWQYGINFPMPTKEIAFWTGNEPFDFERLGGMRSTFSIGHAVWVVYGKNDKPTAGQAPNGWVRLWASSYSTGRTISFGTGCKGRLPKIPRMHADEQFAQLSLPYWMEFEDFPANANFFLVLGTKCVRTDLTLMGAPGCELNIDFPIAVPLKVNAAGTLMLTWNVPNDSNLIGQYFFTQSWVVSPVANALLAVTTNALRTTISR